jgi:hypothetical protein
VRDLELGDALEVDTDDSGECLRLRELIQLSGED